jgi:hypothetical protein
MEDVDPWAEIWICDNDVLGGKVSVGRMNHVVTSTEVKKHVVLWKLMR